MMLLTVTCISASGLVSFGGPGSVYSHAMNTQSACSILFVIACLCQRRGGTLGIFMACLCQRRGGTLGIFMALCLSCLIGTLSRQGI